MNPPLINISRFFKQLYALQVPVSKKDIDWAANWLVQHIINTGTQTQLKAHIDNMAWCIILLMMVYVQKDNI